MAINIKGSPPRRRRDRDDYLPHGEERTPSARRIDAQSRSKERLLSPALRALANELHAALREHADQGGRADAGHRHGCRATRQTETLRTGASPAAPAAGWIVLDASATTTIPNRRQPHRRSEPALRHYQTYQLSYDAGDLPFPHPRRQRRGGNGPRGLATLRWVAPPPCCNTEAGGRNGRGSPAAPGRKGQRDRVNASSTTSRTAGEQVTGRKAVQYAEEATPIVRRAAYPAANRSGTQHIAVVGLRVGNEQSRAQWMRGRDVRANVPYVLGKMQGSSKPATTNSQTWPANVALGLTLPARRVACGSGVGGRTAFANGRSPTPERYGRNCNVTAVTSTTEFKGQRGRRADRQRVPYLLPRSDELDALPREGALAHRHRRSVDGGDRHAFPNIAAALALGGTGPFIFPDAVNMDTTSRSSSPRWR